jgi:hypothetical protein
MPTESKSAPKKRRVRKHQPVLSARTTPEFKGGVTAARMRLGMSESDYLHHCVEVAEGSGASTSQRRRPAAPGPAEWAALRLEAKRVALEIATTRRLLQEFLRSDRRLTPAERQAIRDTLDRAERAYDHIIGLL